MDEYDADWQEFLRLLNKHPEWLEELRRRLFPGRAEGVSVAALEALRQAEDRLAAINAWVDQLEAAQREAEERLTALIAQVDQIEAAQKRQPRVRIENENGRLRLYLIFPEDAGPGLEH